MPTFTHKPIDPSDDEQLAAIYQLGIESQLPGEVGCTPIPYPTKARIRQIADDESLQRLLVYADGTDLRVAVAFDDEGVIRFCISKPWQDPMIVVNGGESHPNGVAQTAYVYGLVKAHSGGVVKSHNNTTNAAVRKLHAQHRVVVIERDETGAFTGDEIQTGD